MKTTIALIILFSINLTFIVWLVLPHIIKPKTEALCQVRVPLIINGEPSKGYIEVNFDPPLDFTTAHSIYVRFRPIE